MQTVHQLVIGMPGENDATITETIDYIKKITANADDYPYKLLSINYFQALPGTPGYEYMRSRDLIGNTINDEEQYLLKISDINAGAP